MKALNITLLFNGQTEAAFNFYRSVFGGDFIMLQRMKDAPGAPDMPDEEKEKILFVSLPMAGGHIAGMDVPASRPQVVTGSNFMVSLVLDSEEEVTRLFNGLVDGGNVMMSPGQQFWATYFAMLTDKFGISWMLTYNK